MTPYVMATKMHGLATEAESILKATRHRRTTDKREQLHISMNMAVAIENLRECARRMLKAGISEKSSSARKKRAQVA